jgi:hypothetical protein
MGIHDMNTGPGWVNAGKPGWDSRIGPAGSSRDPLLATQFLDGAGPDPWPCRHLGMPAPEQIPVSHLPTWKTTADFTAETQR